MDKPKFDSVPKMIAKATADAFAGEINDYDAEHQLYPTKNSRPFFVWDCINAALQKETLLTSFGFFTSRRGCYEFPIIYDRSISTVYILMRDKRLKQLQSDFEARPTLTYVDALIRILNADKPFLQTSLIGVEMKKFKNDDSAEAIVARIFEQTDIKWNQINGIEIVTFNDVGHELVSLQSYTINARFETVAWQDWSKYIPSTMLTDDLIIPASTPNVPPQPSMDSLRLKKRALQKQLKNRTKDSENEGFETT